MLDNNPVLKERLMAFGAFAGIALFAVAAVDVMVSGGFDLGAERADYHRQQRPSAYVHVMDAANYVSDRFRSISWDEPRFPDNAEAAANEDLAGANDGSLPPEMSEATPGDELHQQIAALYENGEPVYDDADAIDGDSAYVEDDAPAYENESDAEADKTASASESASPW